MIAAHPDFSDAVANSKGKQRSMSLYNPVGAGGNGAF
jgi:hypothetical protein|tara:strand:- start:480 stop:590 length:111 start_codon:yes stop_codon:yes gene_type:complete